jgi:MoaA/NifB/PqqE/SkfB family radical SAM enzyme
MLPRENTIQALGPDCPALNDLIAAVRLDELGHPTGVLAAAQLAEPLTPLRELAARLQAPIEQVRLAARLLRDEPAAQQLVESIFYPHRLAVAACRALAEEWTTEPDRLRRLLAGEPVLSRTVEIHPSLGTCAFRCAMCLWSDKNDLTYQSVGLTGEGLVTTADWLVILDDLAERGVETVVVSGGGEALLNRDLWLILRRARERGLAVQLYTTGLNLPAGDAAIRTELAHLERVRFSVHSPDPATYCRLTGLPEATRPLDRVLHNVTRLIAIRDQLGSGVSIGFGFVIQPLNWLQIEDMANLSASLGVDFLNIRKDEVDITTQLTYEAQEGVMTQLVGIRDCLVAGKFGMLDIDFSDELTLLANGGGRPARRRTDQCRVKFFRPTISPFGLVAPCDLKAEPRFAATDFNFGTIRPDNTERIVATLTDRFVPDACAQCMPSSRSINAVYAKLLTDLEDGIPLSEQSFSRPS